MRILRTTRPQQPGLLHQTEEPNGSPEEDAAGRQGRPRVAQGQSRMVPGASRPILFLLPMQRAFDTEGDDTGSRSEPLTAAGLAIRLKQPKTVLLSVQYREGQPQFIRVRKGA